MPNLSSLVSQSSRLVTTNSEATLTNKTLTDPIIQYVAGDTSFTVPAGTTGERPSSPETGELRFNTDEGSLEQYDGTNWGAVVPDDLDINTLSINGILLTDGESIRVPSGTTGERPASPVTGELRFNTDDGSFEKYDGTSWASLVPSDIDVNTLSINGAQVIDSTGAGSFTDLDQIVKKPEIVSPTDNETDVDYGSLTIEGGVYNAVFGGSRDYREFQIDLATGDFSSPVVSQQVNSDSLTLTTDLDADTEHKVRIRDVDLDGTVGPFSDVVTFTTQSIVFSTLGEAGSGGFYMGTIAAAGTTYYLIVAPNATGCVNGCQWKTSLSSTSGTCSLDDGYANTYPALENSTHPAGNWTATRTIAGFSDWYLPAIDELELFYNNGGGNGPGDPLPAGEDFQPGRHWSSTDFSSNYACDLDFGNGERADYYKMFTNKVRAVRRVPI